MAVFLDIIAPWIIDSWLEAVGTFAFSLPTVAIEHDLAVLVLAGTVTGLAILAWLGVRHLPTHARKAVLIVLLPVVGLPLVAAAGTEYGARVRAGVRRTAIALFHGAQPRTRLQPVAVAPKQAAAPAPTPAVIAAQATDSAVAAHAVDPATLKEAGPQPLASSAARSASAAIARIAGLLTRKAAPKADLRVIPVYYGTDRVAETAGSGGDYSAARAGRLAVGRALVTVPDSDGPRGANGATLYEVREMTPAEVGAAIQLEASAAWRAKGRALLYVHGLNTTFKAAVLETQRIAEAAHFDGPVLLYSWPSAGHAVQYAYDGQSAAEAGPHLAEYVSLVARETGVRSISIVADGLGGAEVLEMLKGLAEQESEGKAAHVVIDDLELRAVDMDRVRFAAAVSSLKGYVGRITLYVTASDRALNISRRYIGVEPRAGDVPVEGPVVIEGVDTVDISEPPFDPKAPRGQDGAAAFAALLGQRLAGGTGQDALDAVQTARGGYWRLKAVR